METKLWQKEIPAGKSEKVKTPVWLEEFTVGTDKSFDLLLAEQDVKSSMAHAKMLAHVGLISEKENDALQQELQNMLQLISCGNFTIEDGVEDIHSQIELMPPKK